MKWLYDLSGFISRYINIDNTYILLILETLFSFFIIYIIKKIGIKLISFIKNNKKEYIYTKKFTMIISIIMFVILLFVWDDYIKSLITLISFISAAITIALRELIFNFFCGIYIKAKKPFNVEDRIEFDDVKGDVVNISSLSFELLEVDDTKENGQSTGKIINVPNSVVFTKPIKNYNKAFKYIWNEITICLPIDCDLKEAKKIIYKIVNNVEIVKSIPNKMKNQINNIGTDYRIYYNKYEPMIYTRVENGHIQLLLRYLVHPKKSRFVESVIWNKILDEVKSDNIKLYENK